MVEIPSRQGFAALTVAANSIVPVVTLGFAQRQEDGSVSIVYTYPHGFGEYTVAASDLLDALLPSADGLRQADAAAINANPHRAIEWHLLIGGVQRVVSIGIPQFEPTTRFWIGTTDSEPLTSDQHKRLNFVAESSASLLKSSASPDELAERLRRLELATELLPALLHVLDVREVFDRLSAIAKKALPHDILLLRFLNEDLSKITTFARTAGGSDLDIPLPNAYPPTVSRAWNFDIIDDHAIHLVEHDKAPAKLGVRSSLRVPFRFDERVIGGLAFLSFEPGKYTNEDVLVAKRLSDHVALAISHHNLAERLADQARRNEELRARTTSLELLDELLATLVDSDDLPDVFGRISAIAAKVLPHTAALLMVRLPDGVNARIYASSGFPGPLPETTEIPEELLKNPDWEHDIFDDLSELPQPRYKRIASLGLPSLLRVPIRLDGMFAGALIFLASAKSAFRQADILAARRIADRIAVTLARDREIAASKRADEATERAAKLEARVRALTEELDSRTGYRRVIGESAEWHQVLKQATQVASTEATVLLLGESGTGKEVVARFVHRASSKHGGPFVALNCAALPEQLLEAELFGYERGAFTGAMQSKPGQLEQAAGGTLFLDEVGEMSPSAQAKFLRVLQEREFQRLGGTRVLRTDARIVAATNRDLLRAIAQGQFREDLYYRLNVFAIRLPALRSRRDDILPLSEAFMGEIGRNIGRPPAGISRDARQMLIDYHWPGNVRELRNILERAAILCDGGLITADHLALQVIPKPAVAASKETAAAAAVASVPLNEPPASAADLHTMERTMIEQALQNARFNKSKAAKALGLTRHQLYVRMRKYGFE